MVSLVRIGILIGVFSALAGCSGSSGNAAPAQSPLPSPSPPPPPANSSPTISGTPATTVTRDTAYSFVPSASDPDGDALTFSIVNPPSWATFNETTGSLTGTPTESDIGVSRSITISVSDGELSASLAPFALEVMQVPIGSATVFWQIPVTNADGSALDDLAGFEVHYGTASQTYTEIVPVDDPTTESVLIDNLPPATYYFAVLAVDATGNKSSLSSEVSKVVQP
jgi:hypothetical protein